MFTRMHTGQNAVILHTIDLVFFMHTNLFKLICGSDMDMILNRFLCFYNPIGLFQNVTKHKFLYQYFICFLTTLMSIFQTFVPQYSLYYV